MADVIQFMKVLELPETLEPNMLYFVKNNSGDLEVYLTDSNGEAVITTSKPSAGTVTGVGLSLPNIFTITNTPVTTAGTIIATLTSQTANSLFIAPDGVDGTPSFRNLVENDIPELSWDKITKNLPTTLSGYGITDAAPLSHVGTNGTSHAVATTSLAGFMSSTDKTKLDGIATGATANTGTVTSVSLSLPSIFTVSGSPVTTSGTLTATLASQTAAYVFAAPSGAAGTPTFRALVASDIPTLNQSTTGNAATATKLATARSISITGDATWTGSFDGSAAVSAALTLAASGATAGTYKSVTVDAKGRVTAGTNPTTVTGYGITDASRSFGGITIAPNGGTTCTTAQMVATLTTLGMFNYATATAKVVWSYAGNDDLSDTGFGNIELAGCVIETFTESGNYTIKLTRPTIGTGGSKVLIYNNQASGSYSPGWREIITSANYTSTGYGTITAGTTVTFDASYGSTHEATLQAGAVTLAFSNWRPSGLTTNLLVKLNNAGLATITFPTIYWVLPDGSYTTSASTYLSTIGRTLSTSNPTWFAFWTLNGGSVIYGKIV